MKRFWEIRNQADDDCAELMLYGAISDSTWWGDEVTPKQFASDLAALGGKNVNVRINSYGGDVFAAHAIYNQLRSYSGKVTVMIDGLAASAATIIMMAGETICMPSNSMIMIHNPAFGVMGYYQADDMIKMASALNEIKESIINAYMSRSSLDRKKLSKLMDEETWMTADTAQEYGFCDEVDKACSAVNMVFDGNVVVVNTVRHSLDRIRNAGQLKQLAAQNHPTTETAACNKPAEPNGAANNFSGGKTVKTIAEFKEQYPDLYNAVVAEERGRIQSIDKIGATLDPILVSRAKYDEPMNAADLALAALEADAQKGRVFNGQREQELAGAKAVDGNTASQTAEQEAISKIVASANKKVQLEGGKK